MARSILAVVTALGLAVAGCVGDRGRAADDLAVLAVSADELTYRATYRYAISGPLARSVRYTLGLARRPPNDLRTVESVTPGADGEAQTIRAWYASRGEERYACAEYTEGVRCNARPNLPGTFGFFEVDEMLRLARTPGAFTSVERAGRTSVAGQDGPCFAAVPPRATPVPVRSPQPRFVPETFRYEYCYTPDGVLLRARRTITGEVPRDVEEERRKQALLEAVSVTRTVRQRDVDLPGPVAEPGG